MIPSDREGAVAFSTHGIIGKLTFVLVDSDGVVRHCETDSIC